jgi:hypothetical protein
VLWFCSTVGGPPENAKQVLEEVLLCIAFGTVPGFALLCIACLLQLIVESVVAALRSNRARSHGQDAPRASGNPVGLPKNSSQSDYPSPPA